MRSRVTLTAAAMVLSAAAAGAADGIVIAQKMTSASGAVTTSQVQIDKTHMRAEIVVANGRKQTMVFDGAAEVMRTVSSTGRQALAPAPFLAVISLRRQPNAMGSMAKAAIPCSATCNAENLSGTVDIIVDIVGYYSPGSGGGQGPKGDPGTNGTNGTDGHDGAPGPT